MNIPEGVIPRKTLSKRHFKLNLRGTELAENREARLSAHGVLAPTALYLEKVSW